LNVNESVYKSSIKSDKIKKVQNIKINVKKKERLVLKSVFRIEEIRGDYKGDDEGDDKGDDSYDVEREEGRGKYKKYQYQNYSIYARFL
jgi:hypothetical protein